MKAGWAAAAADTLLCLECVQGSGSHLSDRLPAAQRLGSDTYAQRGLRNQNLSNYDRYKGGNATANDQNKRVCSSCLNNSSRQTHNRPSSVRHVKPYSGTKARFAKQSINSLKTPPPSIPKPTGFQKRGKQWPAERFLSARCESARKTVCTRANQKYSECKILDSG